MEIYTDGGCSGNPGPGGWAYLVFNPATAQVLAEKSGAEKNTTNNRMELSAVIAALEDLAALGEPVTVYTDSQYVQKGIQTWIHTWKKNGWRTSTKQPVKNADLWRRLDAAAGAFRITWKWVKGHGGNVFNERCDRLTQDAIGRQRP